MADDEKEDEDRAGPDDDFLDSDFSYSDETDGLLRADLVEALRDINAEVRQSETAQGVLIDRIRRVENWIRNNPRDDRLQRAKEKLEGLEDQKDTIGRQLAQAQVRIENIERRLESGGYRDAASSVGFGDESSISRLEELDTSREMSRAQREEGPHRQVLVGSRFPVPGGGGGGPGQFLPNPYLARPLGEDPDPSGASVTGPASARAGPPPVRPPYSPAAAAMAAAAVEDAGGEEGALEPQALASSKRQRRDEDGVAAAAAPAAAAAAAAAAAPVQPRYGEVGAPGAVPVPPRDPDDPAPPSPGVGQKRGRGMASAETHPPFALIARRRQNMGLPPPRLERLDPSFFVVAPGTYDSGGGLMLGGGPPDITEDFLVKRMKELILIINEKDRHIGRLLNFERGGASPAEKAESAAARQILEAENEKLIDQHTAMHFTLVSMKKNKENRQQRGGAKMVGGTNSVYHTDQMFLHRSPRQAPFRLLPGKAIWVTRVQDKPAELLNLAMPLHNHYFKLHRKATLYLSSAKEGIMREPIKNELYDFIVRDRGKDDKEKAELLQRMQDLTGPYKKNQPSKVLSSVGGWTTKAGYDSQFVDFMEEVLAPHGYDGFVRDIDPGDPKTEIVFFDQEILYEVNADGSPLAAGGPAAAGAPPPPPSAASSPADPGAAAAGAAGGPAVPPESSLSSDPGGPSVAPP